MAPTVRESSSALVRLHDEIDRMFQEFSVPSFFPLWPERARWAPALDVYEQDNQVVVEAELPGVPRDAVKISCSDQTLILEGEVKKETEEKREGYYRAERRCGRFHRAVALPQPVEFEKAKAQFRDGVLQITLPKRAQPEEKIRSIPITG